MLPLLSLRKLFETIGTISSFFEIRPHPDSPEYPLSIEPMFDSKTRAKTDENSRQSCLPHLLLLQLDLLLLPLSSTPPTTLLLLLPLPLLEHRRSWDWILYSEKRISDLAGRWDLRFLLIQTHRRGEESERQSRGKFETKDSFVECWRGEKDRSEKGEVDSSTVAEKRKRRRKDSTTFWGERDGGKAWTLLRLGANSSFETSASC